MTTAAIDLVIRDQQALNERLLGERGQFTVVQQLLGLSVAGTATYGLAVGLTMMALGAQNALFLPVALVLAFIGTLSICLPSFWFYTQLSGIDAPFSLVTAQALRVQATTSVMMVGVLPVYAALALAAVLGVFVDDGFVIKAGLFIPFACGFWGITSLYRSFKAMQRSLQSTRQRGGNFLLRMTLCWGAVYSAIAPVALWRLTELLGMSF